jgi:chromosome partitioning protein
VRIWTVANQKGGVGKTTTAVTLGGLLAARGARTLLVDLDPQGSLTSYFGHDPDTLTPSVYALFVPAPGGDPAALLRRTPVERLDLLPASTALATLDRQLGVREGMGLLLRLALRRLEPAYDFALIDCAATLGVLMVNALAACERLIVPVQTEFLALKGLERMMHTLDMIARSRRERVSHIVVPTLFDRRTRASVETLAALRERYPASLWDAAVPVDTQFRDAAKRGLPLSVLAPAARGVEAYAALLDALLGPAPQNPRTAAELAGTG